MMYVSEFIALMGAIVRLLGMLVFGVAAGWFTLYAYRQAGERWRLRAIIYLGFFFFVASAIYFTSAAGIGGFGLGAGAALLFWGLKKDPATEDAEESENEE